MPKVKKQLTFEQKEAQALEAQKRERDAIDARDKAFRANIIRQREEAVEKEKARASAESLKIHSYENFFKNKIK